MKTQEIFVCGVFTNDNGTYETRVRFGKGSWKTGTVVCLNIDGEGTNILRRYDPVAGHLTSCHNLPEKTVTWYLSRAKACAKRAGHKV